MTVYDAIVLRLSEKRGGNTLPAKAIKTTAKYLSENVGLEDAQEFSPLDLPSIVDEVVSPASTLKFEATSRSRHSKFRRS